jgi:S-DNA-T family DNA segregation ATPase FtsK/SpoIIIE
MIVGMVSSVVALWICLPLAAAGVVWALAEYAGIGVAYWRASDRETRASIRDGARIRRGWVRVVRLLELVAEDRAPRLPDRWDGRTRAKQPRFLLPRIQSVTPDQFGVQLEVAVKHVPGVGMAEFAKRAQHLADHWGMQRVAVRQKAPGVVTVRAVRTDPLVLPLNAPVPRKLATLERVPIGVDDYARPVNLTLKNASGIGVYGTPGFGKSVFIRNLMCQLAPSRAAHFIVLDGKTATGLEGDYQEISPRCLAVVGDDLKTANGLLKQVVEFRQLRSSTIREKLGTANMWDIGPSEEWPLILVFIDEAHTYFQTVTGAGSNPALKARNALAASNALLVEDLAKKGRNVGVIPVSATQKGTADATPTAIRDVLTAFICFAVRSRAAAEAALGPEINQYPDANPTSYLRDEYRGVASMAAEGMPGFLRMRTPWMPPELAAAVADRTAHYVHDAIMPMLTIGTGHRAALAPAAPAALPTAAPRRVPGK